MKQLRLHFKDFKKQKFKWRVGLRNAPEEDFTLTIVDGAYTAKQAKFLGSKQLGGLPYKEEFSEAKIISKAES